MQDLTFSVVIPAHNRERFLGETLQSVLEQTYPPAEVIVVDDGSSDGTAGVVSRLSNTTAVKYYCQPNQGPSVARNTGVALAKGDWIAFLDADDIWRPEKLEIQAQHARRHPEADMLWCDVEYIDELGQPRDPIVWNDRLAPLMFNRSMCPVPSTVIMRRATFLAAGGFNPAMRCYEDGEFFMRIAARYKIFFIDHPLVKYRCHPTQQHRNVRCRATSWPLMYQLLADLWRGEPAKQAILLKASAANHTHFGKHFLRRGDYPEARRHFRISFEQDPFLWRNLRRWGLSYVPAIRELYRRIKKHAVRV
jgi:glycosyltransferase involved in cell wall biosynthesis